MNIDAIIEYVNKEYGYAVSSAYYQNIAEWNSWWEGKFKPFHEFKEKSDNRTIKRDMYSLKMAKKICEDWAAIVLNEKTEIVVDDESSNVFLQGVDGLGGVLGANDFWNGANELVERAFMSGTGAFVLRLNNMTLKDDVAIKSEESEISIEFLSAEHIIPLTIKNGRIIEVAFVSETLVRGKKYIYIELHLLENGIYHIINSYFKDDNGKLVKEPTPKGVAESFITGSDVPLFSIFTPNISNNIDKSCGLGLSVFSDAIDNLKGVDLAYNNFNRDLKLGGKKVFLNKELVRHDENGMAITPDDVAQQLFLQVGEEAMPENGQGKMIHEYNPSLRIAENKDAVQAQLDYLSFKCGLGTKHYQFSTGNIVTATQYMGDKQELVQNASKHYITIERALKQLVRGILWAGKELGNNTDPDAQVTVNFEDGYIIDKESERQRDLQEVRDGLLQKWEYRVKWRGESEDIAKEMTGAGLSDDILMGFGGD